MQASFLVESHARTEVTLGQRLNLLIDDTVTERHFALQLFRASRYDQIAQRGVEFEARGFADLDITADGCRIGEDDRQRLVGKVDHGTVRCPVTEESHGIQLGLIIIVVVPKLWLFGHALIADRHRRQRRGLVDGEWRLLVDELIRNVAKTDTRRGGHYATEIDYHPVTYLFVVHPDGQFTGFAR